MWFGGGLVLGVPGGAGQPQSTQGQPRAQQEGSRNASVVLTQRKVDFLLLRSDSPGLCPVKLSQR